VQDTETGRVVVGIGRSAGAYQALRYGVTEARRRGVALFAVRTFWSAPSGQALLSAEFLTTAAFEQVDTAFTEALGGRPPDLQIVNVVREGETARRLVGIANRETDVLVIGGCGVRRRGHFRSTAVARFCAREAICPVVIVPPTALARSANADRLARDTARDVEDYLGAKGPEFGFQGPSYH
jgi:nucleotide-binding universal stress UspA family protein